MNGKHPLHLVGQGPAIAYCTAMGRALGTIAAKGRYSMALPLLIAGLMAFTVAEQAVSVSQMGAERQYVQFAGRPEFVEAGDQTFRYAINSSRTVLQIGNEYFLFHDGRWLKATSAAGPYLRTEQLPLQLTVTSPTP
jgi:hypothetical protein